MVQGLGFLSKKSWHVKNISNQKKVWEAEQRKAQEDAKTKELAKQIQQEREEEELERLAGKSNNGKRLDRGIDWMYQHQAKVEEQVQHHKQEEYLLGKEYVPEGGAGGGDFVEEGDNKEGVNAVVAAAAEAKPSQETETSSFAAGRSYEPSVAERNEQFRIRNEDPMFLVGRQQHQKQKKIEQRQALLDRVGGGSFSRSGKGDDDDRKEERHRRHKAIKKERKRERKEKRKRRRRAEYSDESDDDDYERKRRRRKKGSRRDDERDRRRHRRSRSRSRSISVSDNDQSTRRRGLSSEDRFDRRKRRSPSRSRSPGSRRRWSSRSPSSHDHTSRDDRSYRAKDPPSHPRKIEGYGLQGASSAPAKRHDEDLGPDRRLLDRKRREVIERKQQAQQHRHWQRSSAEDRARALRDMQDDARHRTDARLHSRSSKDDDDDTRQRSAGGAKFLHEMARESVMDRERSRLERRHRSGRDDYR